MEVVLADKGFRPTVVDSEALWLSQRSRAAELGRKALILVGDSRMLLDIDQDVMRRSTNLEPVQLAVDGSSFLPVLAGLARDSKIRGTILVNYYDANLASETKPSDEAARAESDYEKSKGHWYVTSDDIEMSLSIWLHGRLRSYADGAQPLNSLLLRVLKPDATQQYLISLPDRSLLADYRKVTMPLFYFERVFRTLGSVRIDRRSYSDAELERILEQKVQRVRPADNRYFERQLDHVEELVSTIQSRGGRVVFVVLPTSGLVRRIEARRYPRKLFWDRLVATTSAQTIDYRSVPALGNFPCPDGSHLDYRDRGRFTTALVEAIGFDSR